MGVHLDEIHSGYANCPVVGWLFAQKPLPRLRMEVLKGGQQIYEVTMEPFGDYMCPESEEPLAMCCGENQQNCFPFAGPGIYTLKMTIDATNVIKESNEGDNSAQRIFTVKGL